MIETMRRISSVLRQAKVLSVPRSSVAQAHRRHGVRRIFDRTTSPLGSIDAGVSPWVLVVDSGIGQNRTALAAVRALAEAGYRPAVTTFGKPGLAAVSRYCQRVVYTPRVDSPDFATAVGTEAAAHPYLGVLPTTDAALVALSAAGAEFVDKARLAERAAQAGLRMPGGRTFDSARSLINAADELHYPVVVKPSLKSRLAHRPALRVRSSSELFRYGDAAGPFMVQPYIDGEMHSVAGVMWQGRLVAAVHQRHLRIWPSVCGDACAAVTTSADAALNDKVQRLLTGYDGIFQAEFVNDYLLDVNPRVYGSLPLATAAGANLVGLYWDLVREQVSRPVSPRVGVKYCWWEGDARHVLSGWRQGQITTAEAATALPAGAAASALAEILDDPRPVISRVRYAYSARRATSATWSTR